MGPLIKIKSAVKQVVPEHGSGSPVGPAEVGPLQEEVLPAAPRMSPKSRGTSESPSRAARLGSGQGGGPGCGVTSSPRAAGGDGDRDVLCHLGKEPETCGIPSCPRPPGTAPRAVGFVFIPSLQLRPPRMPQHSKPGPRGWERTGTPRTQQSSLCPKAHPGLQSGWFFPVFWSDSAPLAPATSLSSAGSPGRGQPTPPCTPRG